MKTTIIILLAAIFIIGCQNEPAQLSDTEKQQIKSEVKTVFDQMMKGANDHIPDEMMKHAWNSESFIYASNGNISTGWEPMMKQVTSIHTNPHFKGYTVTIQDSNIRVINTNAAMVTGIGTFGNFPTKDGAKDIEVAVTFLFEKIDGNWLVTVGHESTSEKLF